MYKIFITEKAEKQIMRFSKKDAQHVKDVISLCLGEFLKTISKRCNKKSLEGSKYGTYRLHVSMMYTVFYRIDDDAKLVAVIGILGINQAHGKYDLF